MSGESSKKRESGDRDREVFIELLATSEDNIREIMNGLRDKKEKYFTESTLLSSGQADEALIAAVELGLMNYEEAQKINRGIGNEDEWAEKRVERLKSEVIEKLQ